MGAFYPFLKSSISTITDRCIPFQEAFGMESDAMEQELFSQENPKRMTPVAEAFIREHLPDPDNYVDFINSIIQCINSERNIFRVDDIVNRFFKSIVGKSPENYIKLLSERLPDREH